MRNVAIIYEVLWVSLQRWRGVASHFNFGTPLDTRLFLLGGAAIAVTVAVIVALTVLAFTAMQAPRSMALAIRAGLLILLVAQAVGGWMIQHGVGPAGDGVTTGLTTFGAAGVMKVPHAVAIHGIQVLPALAWLLSFATLPEGRRVGLVATATLGYIALVVVSVLQTATGVAPFDVGAVAGVLYLVGVSLLGASFVCALLALRRSSRTNGHSPTGSSAWPAASLRSEQPEADQPASQKRMGAGSAGFEQDRRSRRHRA